MAAEYGEVESQALAPVVLPTSLANVKAAVEQFEEMKQSLLTAADVQQIVQNGQPKTFVKKAGWRKLAIAFNVSTQILDRTIIRDDSGRTMSAEFVVRATAPNGRAAEGFGACSVWESRFEKSGGKAKAEHDVPATAETRATNRACSNLFGLGEVSFEEVEGGSAYGSEPQAASDKPKCPDCGKDIFASKFKEGEFYCNKKFGGCGWQGLPGQSKKASVAVAPARPTGKNVITIPVPPPVKAAPEVIEDAEYEALPFPTDKDFPAAVEAVYGGASMRHRIGRLARAIKVAQGVPEADLDKAVEDALAKLATQTYKRTFAMLDDAQLVGLYDKLVALGATLGVA